MGYGAGMKKLSPCSDRTVLDALAAACMAPRALLDAGCGRGERLAAIGAALPGTACFGVELDVETAAAARANCPGAEIVTGDVCALPWADGFFDAALCECTLSLLDAPELCLAELHRMLAPGGTLLLSDLVSAAAAPVRTLLSPDGAVRYLASRSWTETALTAAGFRVLAFRDCREEYITMAAQMIFDCDGSCVGPEVFAALRRERTGYGLWTLERSADI